jgi:membrane protein insertase Oxa1/YidC/SpoIIIJ
MLLPNHDIFLKFSRPYSSIAALNAAYKSCLNFSSTFIIHSHVWRKGRESDPLNVELEVAPMAVLAPMLISFLFILQFPQVVKDFFSIKSRYSDETAFQNCFATSDKSYLSDKVTSPVAKLIRTISPLSPIIIIN